jgi:hypothetical protein
LPPEPCDPLPPEPQPSELVGVVVVGVVVVVVVVVAVVVAVATRLLSTERQPPEEYAIFIGPLEPAIGALTARTNTRQRSRRLRPPHNPRIIIPTFSP